MPHGRRWTAAGWLYVDERGRPIDPPPRAADPSPLEPEFGTAELPKFSTRESGDQ